MKKKGLLQNQNPRMDEAEGQAPISRYEKAYLEWSTRLGNAALRAKNWQRMGILSLALCLCVVIALIMLLASKKTVVYVAQISPGQSIQYIKMPQTVTPSSGQQLYFIGQFLNDIMALPLDPVIARQNWLNAYAMSDGAAKAQLTTYATASNPFAQLGKQTQTVQIQHSSAMSNNSTTLQWMVTTYNQDGKQLSQVGYSGVFTLGESVTPTTQAELLQNPFGLRIVYFTIYQEASS